MAEMGRVEQRLAELGNAVETLRRSFNVQIIFDSFLESDVED